MSTQACLPQTLPQTQCYEKFILGNHSVYQLRPKVIQFFLSSSLHVSMKEHVCTETSTDTVKAHRLLVRSVDSRIKLPGRSLSFATYRKNYLTFPYLENN